MGISRVLKGYEFEFLADTLHILFPPWLGMVIGIWAYKRSGYDVGKYQLLEMP
jgi:hypothetical protein